MLLLYDVRMFEDFAIFFFLYDPEKLSDQFFFRQKNLNYHVNVTSSRLKKQTLKEFLSQLDMV